MEGAEWFGIGLSAGLLLGLGLALAFRVLGAWLGALSSGAPVPLLYLIGMRLRRSPIQLVTDAHVAMAKRGRPVDLGQVEGAFLAHRSAIRNEQDLVRVIEQALAADGTATEE